MKSLIILIVGIALGISASYIPSLINAHQNSNQPYADEQGRMISSLSSSDVEQLQQGKGWGLAKPAEFNGYPGPTHIIELAGSLDLTDEQLAAVQDSFAGMKEEATVLGKALIDAEKALDAAFVSKRISKEELNRLLADAENVRAKLRAVHLAAHLEVTPLLSEEQKNRYAELRGYGAGGHNGHGSH